MVRRVHFTHRHSAKGLEENVMTRLNTLRAALFAAALSIPMAATVSAQPPVVIGGGLVNVQIIDVIDDVEVVVRDINVNVSAAVQIAANLCGIAVGVIAEDLQDGTVRCDAVTGPAEFVVINR
jgi:hypothetical protein